MSTAALESSRPVAPIDLKVLKESPASTPLNTPETTPMSEEPAKMKKPSKMKKAPRRSSVALAQASPSMLEGADGGISPKAFMSYDAGPGGEGATTPRAMKKPMKKAAPRRASLMPGQTPSAAGASSDFKPSLAPIPASERAAEPEDTLGQMPAKAAPKPKGGNLKGKGAKRTSVANLGADPDMLKAMAEAGIEEGNESEEDEGSKAPDAAAAPAPAPEAAPAAEPAAPAGDALLEIEDDV